MAALAVSTKRKMKAGMTRLQIFKEQLKYQSAVNGEPAKEKEFKAGVTRMTEPMVFGWVTERGVHRNVTPAFDWALHAAYVGESTKVDEMCGGAGCCNAATPYTG